MITFNKLITFAKEDNRICAISREGNYTYSNLYKDIRVYIENIMKFCTENTCVMLIGDKENRYIAGIFSALMTGHPYVAVPSSYPVDRIIEIMNICLPAAVLDFSGKFDATQFTNGYSREQLEEMTASGIIMHDEMEIYDWQEDDTAAWFFTSGSTGSPKGVCITYGNLCCMLRKREYTNSLFFDYSQNEQPVVLNFISYSFIASVPTIFGDICDKGAILYAVERDRMKEFSSLMSYMVEISPTHFTATPAFLDICLRNDIFCKENFPRLQVIYSGGGVVNMDLVRRFRDKFDCELVNVYGLTEATSTVLYSRASQVDLKLQGFMPSGSPLPETDVYIMDEQGNPVNEGNSGELYIVSRSICNGYCNADNGSFFVDDNGVRGYRTGDYFKRVNGNLYYMGRKDNMVKVGNQRIEIFDIEEKLIQCEDVRDGIVVPCIDNGEAKFLVAFVVTKPGIQGGINTTLKIKRFLKGKLQPYAVPQRFVYLDSIPRTVSNKPDRKKLETMASEMIFGKV